MPSRTRERITRLKVPIAAALLAVVLLSLAIAMTVSAYRQHRHDAEVTLRQQAASQAQTLDGYFARGRSLTKLLSQNTAFRAFYEEPGTRNQKIQSNNRALRAVKGSLSYLERLYPRSVGEACFIDMSGSENARSVRGVIAPNSNLSSTETRTSFFAPTFAHRPGQVYQASPYVSPDTGEWVVSNSTQVKIPGRTGRAIVHFEVTIESLRRDAAKTAGSHEIAVVDAKTGRTVFDTDHPQPAGPAQPLGPPDPTHFFAFATGATPHVGTVDGHLAAVESVRSNPTNANHWVVVAASKSPAPTWLGSLGLAEVGVIGWVVALLGLAIFSVGSSQRVLRKAADEDPLTSLGNRRKLTRELQARLASVTDENPLRLAIFDLNGFKDYNDTFGHPAGDALLVRLAHALEAALSGIGDAYRVGGDEFCVLARDADHDALAGRAEEALTERGEAFSITASCGWVELPGDTSDPDEALRLADQRMYASKANGRISAGSQSTDVLVQVLAERHPEIGIHVDTVTELSTQVAAQLGLPEEERTAIRQAASLHDIGKVAIPDSVLNKPGPLDEEEWAFIRQHTLIGESILEVAPALKVTSQLVRSCHESFDGAGYPDQLAGEDIPLGSRVIAVCDAFDAMVSERPYAGSQSSAKALAEIRRCAGTQFDPGVVEAFALVLAAKSNGHKPSPQSYKVKAASTT
ncbi:MAG: hypothetical protein QOD14_1545 [Solirubrobacterales bacterium]|nr:hypothetical protein [Solirubrobacterales bacterium]